MAAPAISSRNDEMGAFRRGIAQHREYGMAGGGCRRASAQLLTRPPLLTRQAGEEANGDPQLVFRERRLGDSRIFPRPLAGVEGANGDGFRATACSVIAMAVAAAICVQPLRTRKLFPADKPSVAPRSTRQERNSVQIRRARPIRKPPARMARRCIACSEREASQSVIGGG